jgi:hypothetical protein
MWYVLLVIPSDKDPVKGEYRFKDEDEARKELYDVTKKIVHYFKGVVTGGEESRIRKIIDKEALKLERAIHIWTEKLGLVSVVMARD